ncbi:uncharacterized protein LOC133299850 [Gastrolobium bilobum]|uniref:uncharacterized protein LOC133299850 n=1 Tax=Gastrolobium bilobum TaxID=150636 RepID=UPI002AB284B2|nr:uncharacterized protein LOC133299850 [Gastrolobium bilobum]
MSANSDIIRVVLYFNGRKEEGRCCVIFVGEKRPSPIKRNSTVAELHQKIRQKLCLQDNQMITLVTARLWQCEQYISLQVVDDEDIDMVMEEFLNQCRKDFLELYVDTTTAEEVVIPMRLVRFTSPFNESSSAVPAVNMFEEDEHDPTWVMDEEYDEDDEENIAMEDRLLLEDASASDNDEECGRSGTELQPLHDLGESRIVVHHGTTSSQVPEHPEEAQMAIKRYLMKEHQEAIVVESTPTKLSMKCCAHVQGCPWRVRVIKPTYGENWKVKKWGGKHNCLNDHLSQDHRQLDFDVIAALVVEMIKNESLVAISLVQERITHSYGFKVSYRKAWYAKQKAMAMLYGDWEESYAFLPNWCEYMLPFHQVPFTIFKQRIVLLGGSWLPFVRCFWTFRQCCEAFKFCKPMIQIDGTHLYGKYKGKLLIATAQDGKNECVPFAFAVVEGETLEAW